MPEHHVGVPSTTIIPQREIEGRESNKILFAFVRPRGQDTVTVEKTEEQVTVNVVNPGYALVDIVDEESYPLGVAHEFLALDEELKAGVAAAADPTAAEEPAS